MIYADCTLHQELVELNHAGPTRVGHRTKLKMFDSAYCEGWRCNPSKQLHRDRTQIARDKRLSIKYNQHMVKIFHVLGSARVEPFWIAAMNNEDAFLRAKESGSIPRNSSRASWRRLPKLTENRECIDEFLSRYELLKNHLDPYAGFEGAWFETFGEQEAYARQSPPSTIWTIVEGEDITWLIAGFHRVDRLGYVITSTAWNSDDECYAFV